MVRWTGLALASLLAFGSGDPARSEGVAGHRVRSLIEIRNQGVVRQHWDLTCGAAAIATVLTYQFALPVSEQQAAMGMLQRTSPLLVRARLGFSLLDLKRFAASRGLTAAGYGGLTLDELLALAPVIAPIRLNGFGHFVVVRGAMGDRVLLADPAFGNRTVAREAFVRSWPSQIGFVVTAPGQPHPPNRMAPMADLLLVPPAVAVRTAEATARAWRPR